MVTNFVEVFLAKEGHNNPVGINYLEKVQIPHLPSIYGAMLAGVGYVLMGAGIPLHIPGVLEPSRRTMRPLIAWHVTGASQEPVGDSIRRSGSIRPNMQRDRCLR